MDRLTSAKVLLESVARGSISAAAVHLEMSRAMATRYIADMEAWAGARLLHRTTRKLSLTAAGEEILPICKKLVSLSDDISAVGDDAAQSPRGLLRVTASSIFAEYRLTDALTAFLARHPAVRIDLQIMDRTTNLAQDGIDLAIRVTRHLDPGVIGRKIGTVRSIVCASPAYLASRGAPTNAMELSGHNCLTYAHYAPSVWNFRVAEKDVSVPVAGNFSTNEAAIVVRAAINGAGIALLPQFAAETAIANGRLVQLLPDVEVEALHLFAAYLSKERMTFALRLLIDYLAAYFRTAR